MKRDFNREMEDIISSFNGEKPKILLHSCCAPCSTACIERLTPYFDITVFYYNPNLDTEREYKKRSAEQIKLCEILGIKYVICDFDTEDYYSFIKGYEGEREGGARCERCFNLRLNKTCEYAEKNGFDYFATTLTVSPLKNAEKINAVGETVAFNKRVKYLPTDFKKKNGYLRSTELSKKYEIYRQDYCGCIFSKKEREESKNEK